jgi:RimJ/RimL family protein N-acetyltransferase
MDRQQTERTAQVPAEMEPGSQYLTLRDGTIVLTRPIQPSDAVALQQFHSRLSAESIYRRFFESLPVLSPQQAAHFTQLDGVTRYARVALDPTQPEAIIAVVRYDREPGTDKAEYAIVVEDAWQGRGLGRGLTRQLVAEAVGHGIRHLYAFVLPENSWMLILLRHLGYPAHTTLEGSCLRLDLDLTAPAAGADGIGAAPSPSKAACVTSSME